MKSHFLSPRTLALIMLCNFACLAQASQPNVIASELNGTFRGESFNGSCKVEIVKTNDILVFKVDQNSEETISMPVYASLVTNKISGDKCGRVVKNNDCGPYEVKDNMDSGSGHNNELYISLVENGGQRCLKVAVADTIGEWSGANYCNINLNRSGRGCGPQ